MDCRLTWKFRCRIEVPAITRVNVFSGVLASVKMPWPAPCADGPVSSAGGRLKCRPPAESSPAHLRTLSIA